MQVRGPNRYKWNQVRTGAIGYIIGYMEEGQQMSKVTATITVTLERADGSVTTITEAADDSLGGNPRFEGYESKLLIEHVSSLVLDRLPNAEQGIA